MQQHRRFELKRTGQGWLVGDIHGEFCLLTQLLERAGFDPAKDCLFAVGDLIDRGPDSRRCLELLHEDWFHSTLGNHEQALLMGLDDEGIRVRHRSIGGGWLYSSRGQNLKSSRP